MVRGTSRRVIVVESPDTNLFEQAIFIVRNDALSKDGVTAQQLVDEACRVARSYTRSHSTRRPLLRLLTLRDSRLFRVKTIHRIMLCMVAFLGLHLALGNTDLLLLQGRLHDLRLFRSGFFTACIKFIRLHHRADKLALF